MKKFKYLTIYPDQRIKEAINKINTNLLRTLMVVDNKFKLLGVLNDGDIRRSFLEGASIEDTINRYFTRRAVYFRKNEASKKNLRKILIEQKLNIIPIVDKKNKLVDYFSLKPFLKKDKKVVKRNIPTVVMMGGKGTRLKPFTDILPKPLIPIGEKPILEHILEKFLDHGINYFIFTVHFKAKIIKAYIQELKQNIKIKCDFIDEKKPLGTVGGLKFLYRKIKKDFFVTNCDTIIKTDLSNVYDFHKRNNNVITLIVSVKEFKIPYGVCEIYDSGEFNNLIEKPKSNYLVNTGFYVLKPKILKYIPKNKEFAFNQLINLAKKKKLKIGLYPINDKNWIDVGQWDEYKNTLSRMGVEYI